jgi:hypothetical protein
LLSNFLSNLLDRNNFQSHISSNWQQKFILESVFKICDIEKDFYFTDIFNVLNKNYNKNNKKSDLYIFFSLVSGNKSITHRDEYDVIIVGLFGKVVYIVENEYFTVEPGDLLIIEKNKLHKAIGLTPRITLSYGIYE